MRALTGPMGLAMTLLCLPLAGTSAAEVLLVPRQVTATVERRSNQIVVIHSAGGDIETTPNHPFATPSGWVRADGLVPGSEILRLGTQETTTVLSVRSAPASHVLVYNISVERSHCYAVSSQALLVHNTNCGNGLSELWRRLTFKARSEGNAPNPYLGPIPGERNRRRLDQESALNPKTRSEGGEPNPNPYLGPIPGERNRRRLAQESPSIRKVKVLATGGTMSMVESPEGLKADPNFPEHFTKDPELNDSTGKMSPGDLAYHLPDTNIHYDVHKISPAIDSTNITDGHWRTITDEAKRAEREGYHGVAIIHGTDTLGYSGAELHNRLPGIQIPVVITGSQNPFRLVGSDGKPNLIGSISVAGHEGTPAGVVAAINGRILRGSGLTKIHAQDSNAFDTPNHRELGRFHGKTVTLDGRDTSAIQDSGGLPSTEYNGKPPRIAHVHVNPSLTPEMTKALLKKADAAVVHSYGSGNVPDGVSKVLQKYAAGRDGWFGRRPKPTVVITGTGAGAVMPGHYATSLRGKNIVAGGYLTAEQAHAHLNWGFQSGLPLEGIVRHVKHAADTEKPTQVPPVP